MQGDRLSPLLFTLFLSDIVNFLNDKGNFGLPITPKKLIIMLLFAHNIVLLCQLWHKTCNALNTVMEYCEISDFKLNPANTRWSSLGTQATRKVSPIMLGRRSPLNNKLLHPFRNPFSFFGKTRSSDTSLALLNSSIKPTVLYCSKTRPSVTLKK